MKTTDDLPNIQSLIEVTNSQNGSRWLALDGFYHWEQPTPPEEERTDVTRREIWYILRGYLVHQQNCDVLYEWAVKQDFMGRWMPEGPDLYHVFLGEFYGSPAYAYHTDPFEGATGWQGNNPNSRIPKPILPLVETYLQENSSFDCSIDDGISITVPNQLIANQMALSWHGAEGKYFNKKGELIAFDPSVTESGPRVLLIHRESFLSFLQKNNYSVVWTILGEKQLIGGSYGRKNWKGRLELSGAFCLQDGQLVGKITPKFRSPHDPS